MAKIEGLVHGFTSRSGGVSQGTLSSLNLAPRPGSSSQALRENWRRVAVRAGLPGAPVALVEQVHGVTIVDGDEASGPDRVVGTGDAVVVTRPGILAVVRVADCVPILLAVPGGVAAVHAGWRGTAGAIVQHAVAALCRRTGAVPGQVIAAVGPCIALDAYEVGEEVVQGIAAVVPEVAFVRREGPRPHVDLKAANAWLLAAVGVSRVEVLGHCTHQDTRFYSHRRDGAATGRQAGVIAWSP